MVRKKQVNNQDPRQLVIVFLVGLVTILVITLTAFIIAKQSLKSKLEPSQAAKTVSIDKWGVSITRPAGSLPLTVEAVKDFNGVETAEIVLDQLENIGCGCDTNRVVGRLIRYPALQPTVTYQGNQLSASEVSDDKTFIAGDYRITYEIIERKQACRDNCFPADGSLPRTSANQIIAGAQATTVEMFESLKLNQN